MNNKLLIAIILIILIFIFTLLYGDYKINIIMIIIFPVIIYVSLKYLTNKSDSNLFQSKTYIVPINFGEIYKPLNNTIKGGSLNNNAKKYEENIITKDTNRLDNIDLSYHNNNDKLVDKLVDKNDKIDDVDNDNLGGNDEEKPIDKWTGLYSMNSKELMLLMNLFYTICERDAKKITRCILFEGIKKDNVPNIIKIFLEKTKIDINNTLSKLKLRLFVLTYGKSMKYVIKYSDKQNVDKNDIDILLNKLNMKFNSIELNYEHKCKQIINEAFNSIISNNLITNINNINYLKSKIQYKPSTDYTWSITYPTSNENIFILSYPNINDEKLAQSIENKWRQVRLMTIDDFNFKFDYICRLVVLLHEFVHLIQIKGLNDKVLSNNEMIEKKVTTNKIELEASLLNYMFINNPIILDTLLMTNIYQCLLFNFSIVKCLHENIDKNIITILNKWAETLGKYKNYKIDDIVVHVYDREANSYIKNKLAFDYFDIELCISNNKKFIKKYWELFIQNLIINEMDNDILSSVYKKYKFEKYWN